MKPRQEGIAEGYLSDIDECVTLKNTPCPGRCINIPGSYRCNCSVAGYVDSRNPHSCNDFDECSINNGGCSDRCENIHGSYKCRCERKGYKLAADRHSCEDLNECERYRKACSGGKCFNTVGSYYCKCKKSFVLSEDKSQCIDINECESNNGGCSMGCVNLFGSFKCTCPKDAYTIAADGFSCLDVDECENNKGGCDEKCINTIGSFKCLCETFGKVLSEDGKTCQFCTKNTYFNSAKKSCTNCPKHSYIAEGSPHLSVDECICNKGFEGNPGKAVTCEDIDECSTSTNQSKACSYGCINTPGSAYCTCPNGFTLQENQRDCTDIDECASRNGDCQQICENVDGSYYCECHRPGFILSNEDNKTCLDIDECADGFGCEYDCVNTNGSAYCACAVGFELAPDMKNCTDVDECLLDNSTCGETCINLEGSYECICSSAGMKLSYDRFSCIDINECVEGFNPCEENCVNTIGSFYCECLTHGFELTSDGFNCSDVDECASELKNGCDQLCYNVPGSYDCDCNPGYWMDTSLDCIGCLRNTYRSKTDVICVQCPNSSHTDGPLKTSIKDCFCNEGYQGSPPDNIPCEDIDECENNYFACEHKCHNTPGSVHCSCPKGFQLTENKKNCTDINECLSSNGNCAQICINTIGSHHCECEPERYVLAENGFSCSDVNECAKENDGCSQICVNTVGSSYCACSHGFKLKPNTKNCTDINECEDNYICDDVCVNNNGSFECFCNKTGFILHSNRRSCIDINECFLNRSICHQACENTQGSYRCYCMTGYTLSEDGYTCQDVDECASNKTHGCSHICINIPGSYQCDCPSGYQVSSGTSCSKCPHDSYRSVNDTGCQRCPTDSFTADAGSTSVEDCFCASGFIRDRFGKEHCTDIHPCLQIGLNCSQYCKLSQDEPYCYCYSGFQLKSNSSSECVDIDECAENNGKCNQVCINTIGSHKCDCNEGFRMLYGDRYTCEETNECDFNNGNCSHQCVNDVGSFHCTCNEGYTLSTNGHSCLPSDGCESFEVPQHAVIKNHLCQRNRRLKFGQRCHINCLKGFNMEGPSMVVCLKTGSWSGHNITCRDINECEENNGKCSQICVNELGGYSCNCTAGYRLRKNGHTCSDMNECQEDNGRCDHQCVNTVGSYFCGCNQGFSLDTDKHSCTSDGCDQFQVPDNALVNNSRCTDIKGHIDVGTVCVISCQEGFVLAGYPTVSCFINGTWSRHSATCKDINECTKDNGRCAHQCINTEGSYLCECNQGYTLEIDGHSCSDIDQCQENNGNCEQNCHNMNGSYVCSCDAGFSLHPDNRSCSDINECHQNNQCEHLCFNTMGSYRCVCNSGFTLDMDKHSCVGYCDMFELPENTFVKNSGCPLNQKIKIGSKCQVQCHKGYRLSGSSTYKCLKNGFWSKNNVTCIDIDECEKKNGKCDHKCVNTLGSYFCKCNDGYSLHPKGHSCIDINECEKKNASCQHTCVNSKGSYFCKCKAGFTLNPDGYSCKAKFCDKFQVPENAIVKNQRCLKDPLMKLGSRCQVKCHKGFRLPVSSTFRCLKDGSWSKKNVSCEDINECEKNNKCDHQCINTPGSYFCKCDKGYTLDSKGHSCKAEYCETFHAPVNADVKYKACLKNQTLQIGTKCPIKCHKGFHLDGSSTLRCLKNGSWSRNNVTCEDIDECEKNNGKCEHQCVNTMGSYFCKCDPGYHLNPNGRTCSASVCNTLTAPDNNNNVTVKSVKCLTRAKLIAGTKCQLACPKGHEVKGPSFLECLGNGTWSKFKSTCQDINECETHNGQCSNICINEVGSYHCECPDGLNLTSDGHSCLASHCPSLVFPENGQLIPASCQYPNETGIKPGTVCKVKCLKGYTVNGTKSVKCLLNGSWSQKQATCAAKSCPKMSITPHATLEPTICQNSTVPVNTFCLTKCASGYQLVGDAINHCLPSSTWAKESAKCVPLTIVNGIQCPANIQQVLPKRKSYIAIAMPHIENAVDWTVEETWADFKRSTVLFQAGKTVLHLNVKSKSGDIVKCNLTIEAIDQEPPVYRSCPKIVQTVAWGKHPKVFWEIPLFLDNVAVVKIKSNKVPEESEMDYGMNQVIYTGRDSENNFARCIFMVDVKHGRCPELVKPQNGYLRCSYTDDDAQRCTAGCNSYFRFPNNHTKFVFRCPPDSDKWDIPPIQLTHCIDMCKPGSFRQRDTVCEPCAIGTFQNKWEKTFCKPCPLGKTTLAAGAKNQRHCVSISQ
ncbi:fibrillin-1 isoform X2 [Octopus sinensis]|uniref:Fibrillin-1 isoform X2 n=1 Tax=Octopus sinensis TaxID=2607531 RepID=A0A7E6F952_9MOLL|nr:fibrillin-1 isoform X2 [Octopus sinensis]